MITASNATEYSFEGNELSGEGEPSIFTSAVVRALQTGQADRDLDGWIAVDELYDYVYDEVCGRSPQHPVKWVDLEGDLRIAKSVYKPPLQPVQLPPGLPQAIESPERHTRLGAVHALGELLAGDDARLRMTAREALQRLADDDSRLVYEAARRALTAAGPEPARPEDTSEMISSGSGLVSEEVIDIEPEHVTAPTDEVVDAVDEHPKPPSPDLTGLRAVGLVAIAGATAVLASVIPHVPDRQLGNAFYRVPVGLMSVALIALIGGAFRLNRRALLLAAIGLALALLRVTVPMSWRPDQAHVRAVRGRKLGCRDSRRGGSVRMLAGISGSPQDPDGANRTSSRFTRAVLAVTGPLIVIASVFVLHEWARPGVREATTWKNWERHAPYRYPTTMVLLSVLALVLAARGIRSNRRRLLVIAVAVACLALGESVPFIFPTVSQWGAGRWLRIVGAVVAVLGLAAAAARTGASVATSRRERLTAGLPTR